MKKQINEFFAAIEVKDFDLEIAIKVLYEAMRKSDAIDCEQVGLDMLEATEQEEFNAAKLNEASRLLIPAMSRVYFDIYEYQQESELCCFTESKKAKGF